MSIKTEDEHEINAAFAEAAILDAMSNTTVPTTMEFAVALNGKHFELGLDDVSPQMQAVDRAVHIEPVLTINDICELHKVSRTTVWRWMREKGLKVRKNGGVVRVKGSDFNDFLRRNELCSN